MTRIASPLPLSLLGAALSLSACTMGPDYVRPASPAPQAEARGAYLRGDKAVTASAPTARWWETFEDPVLNRLIDDAIARSPNLQVMQARITQARAGLAASKTALLPSIGTSFIAPYVNLPAGALGIRDDERIDNNSYSLGFDASWELDLFGGNRRRIESAVAQGQSIEASVASAQVSLSAEIARAYMALRLRQTMATMLEEEAGIDRSLAEMARQRFQVGTAPAQPLAMAEARLAETERKLVGNRAETTVLLDQIAVLTGQEPGALDTILTPGAPIPLPPVEVAVGDPATLLRNRPDIRQAERQLAAATADIGVKEAARFPRISFMGLLGLGGPDIGGVVDPSSIVSVALPQIRWSIFDGGRTTANIHRARGARDEAEANYRATILSALQDAESALARFGAQRLAFVRTLEARDRIVRATGLQVQRATVGTASRADGLEARRQALEAELAAASTRADLATGFISVQKALGLGWEAPRPAVDPVHPSSG